MRHLITLAVLLLFGEAAIGQSDDGQVRGRIKTVDSLKADYCQVTLLQQGDTVCTAFLKFEGEFVEYITCNAMPEKYTLCIDMRGFNVVHIENVVIRADAITFQDVSFGKELLQKEGVDRKVIRLPFKPPAVKGCG